jgi:hypothetical protein
MKTKLALIVVFLFCQTFFTPLSAGEPASGEPVPGAEVFVELEPDDQPIMATASKNGTFTFENLKAGTYHVVVRLPENPKEAYTNKEAIKSPNLKKSGFYHKKGEYFLSKNRGLFILKLEDFKKVNEAAIKVSSKKMGSKESKTDAAILDFQVTGKGGKIVISLESVKPKEYNARNTSAMTSGPYGESLSNIEDNKQ